VRDLVDLIMIEKKANAHRFLPGNTIDALILFVTQSAIIQMAKI
jgi:hypothetical protein